MPAVGQWMGLQPIVRPRCPIKEGHRMLKKNIGWGSLVAILVVWAGSGEQASGQQSGNSDDSVAELVSRLDLERYKATIKGLTAFGDRRQGTRRNRDAVAVSYTHLTLPTTPYV